MRRWIEVIRANHAGGATSADELAELLDCTPDQLVPLSGAPLEPQQCLCNLDLGRDQFIAAQHANNPKDAP